MDDGRKHSRRITLMSVDADGRHINSFHEGEYIFGGVRDALLDAKHAASHPNGFFGFGEAYVVVAVFPIASDGRRCREVGPRWRIHRDGP